MFSQSQRFLAIAFILPVTLTAFYQFTTDIVSLAKNKAETRDYNLLSYEKNFTRRYPWSINTRLNLGKVSMGELDGFLSKMPPIMIYFRGKWTNEAIQLPYQIRGGFVFTQLSTTLCQRDDLARANEEHIDPEETRTLHTEAFTTSEQLIELSVAYGLDEEFILNLDSEVPLSIIPSAPRMFLFEFPEKVEAVAFKFDSSDDKCLVMAVDPRNCPTSTEIDDSIEFGSLSQQVTRKGFLHVEKENFKNNRVYLVLETQLDASVCQSHKNYNPHDPFKISRSINTTVVTPEEEFNYIKKGNLTIKELMNKSDIMKIVERTLIYQLFFFLIAVIFCFIELCCMQNTDFC